MDTLLIVRKIREAEALADSGEHSGAIRLLKSLLGDDALNDSHRKLVSKKIDLFGRQQERMTRIVSRCAQQTQRTDPSDESSAKTAIRDVPGDDPSNRPTDRAPEPDPTGVPTEVVPKARHADTEIPQTPQTRRETEKDASARAGAFPQVETRREVTRPLAKDSQELAPVADEPFDNDESSADLLNDGETSVRVATGADSGRNPSQRDTDKPTAADFPTPALGPDGTPVPQSQSATSDSGRHGQTTVRDSIVVPPPDETADGHFKSPSAGHSQRSNPELKALADSLPGDDLRRELALEVVRLREELETVEKESARQRAAESQRASRKGSRRINREDGPDSGSFHIPVAQVNTIVRHAAGTDGIEVHMPNRDDDEADLQVLRRDSVRESQIQSQPTQRIAVAQDYIDAKAGKRASRLKPVATVLGVLVLLGVIGWAIYLGYNAMTSAPSDSIEISESGVGEYTIGSDFHAYAEFAGHEKTEEGEVRGDETGWIVQYAQDARIESVTMPGPEFSGESRSQFSNITIMWRGNTLDLGGEGGAGVDRVRQVLGEPNREFSWEVFKQLEIYTLRYEGQNGARALELHYKTAEPEWPVWIRVSAASADRPPPDLNDYRNNG